MSIKDTILTLANQLRLPVGKTNQDTRSKKREDNI